MIEVFVCLSCEDSVIMGPDEQRLDPLEGIDTYALVDQRTCKSCQRCIDKEKLNLS